MLARKAATAVITYSFLRFPIKSRMRTITAAIIKINEFFLTNTETAVNTTDKIIFKTGTPFFLSSRHKK